MAHTHTPTEEDLFDDEFDIPQVNLSILKTKLDFILIDRPNERIWNEHALIKRKHMIQTVANLLEILILTIQLQTSPTNQTKVM